jgi:hypothetical protein
MPHLERVHGITLHRKMEDCRTEPYLLTCIDENAIERQFIVKLHSQITKGILGEFWCAHLGYLLELPLPTTATIEIDLRLAAHNPEFMDALHLEGPHFGSELIGTGLLPYSGAYNIPKGHFDVAVAIFAFDVLTQNPDRRMNNPNLYFNQNRFWMIDHELALRFEGLIGGARLPWEIPVKDRMFVDHVFYPKLKGMVTDTNLANFMSKLTRITSPVIEQIAGLIPKSLNYPTYNASITEYLLKATQDLPRFQRGLLEVLA